MPNTLVHIGLQGILSRQLFKPAAVLWIYLGLLIPDIPWILQRIIRMAAPAVDLLMLRSYSVVQATLFGSLILAFTLAFFAKQQWKVFSILGFNAAVHLVIDAGQLKYANGVHFLAPFSWEMSNWGFFAIESIVTYILTGFGLVYLFWSWRSVKPITEQLHQFNWARISLISLFGISYFLIPFFFIEKPVEANNHYLKTLIQEEERIGKPIELDRATFKTSGDDKMIKPGHSSEWFYVEGLPVETEESISIKGHFTGRNIIQVSQYKVHTDWFRDMASYAGLILIFLTLLITVFIGRPVKNPISV